MVLTSCNLGIDYTPQLSRSVWLYRDANWNGLKLALQSFDWAFLDEVSPEVGAQRFQDILLDFLIKFIPQKTITIATRSYPWFNDTCLELVRRKRAAWGTRD